MSQSYWLKPLMIVLGLFVIVAFLIYLPDILPSVSWAEINPTIISLLPWLVALGVGLFILVYILGRK